VTVEDDSSASCTFTVTVVDTSPIVITLAGDNPMVVECGGVFTDPGATATSSSGSVPVTSSGTVDVNTAGSYTITYTATEGSNSATATRTVNVVETVTLTLNGSDPMDVVLGTAFVDPGATATSTCGGAVPVTVTGSVDTNTIGTYTLVYTAGDAEVVTRTVNVIYGFTGFFAPVGNPPTLNKVNAGRAIPVKFSLAGDRGLDIFVAGSPGSRRVDCDSGVAEVEITSTLTAGQSTLSYDSSTDQYVYVWKTENNWAGTCRELILQLTDGTVHNAFFKFR
jgi:hypothetical protein